MYAGRERQTRVVALVVAIVLVAGVVLALVATVVQAAPARAVAAHALVSSVPANEASLSQAPEQIQLTFDEAVLPAFTQVRLLRDNTPVELSTPTTEGAVVTAKVLGAPGHGGYRIVWQTATPDGHPLVGETTFGVGQAAPKPRVLPTYKTPQSQATTFGHPDHLPGLIAAGVLLVAGIALLFYEQRRRRRLLAADKHEQQRIS